MTETSTDELIQFLNIVGTKGFINENTATARRTAVSKLVEILDPDQRTVEYLRDNLDVVATRFSNLNKDINGATVDEYKRRAGLVLKDFTEWSQDRAGWERSVSAKQSARAASVEGEKKPRAARKETAPAPAAAAAEADADARILSLPIRPDFEVTVKIPRGGLTTAELRRIAVFLLPYANDWDPMAAGLTGFFNQIDQEDKYLNN